MVSQREYVQSKLQNHIVQFNSKRMFSVRNAYDAIHKYIPDHAIVINLDADDWLIRDDVVDIILKHYEQDKCLLTYGNCLYYNPRSTHDGKPISSIHPYANRRYPPSVERDNTYRHVPFRSFHLRTWRASLFFQVSKSEFLFPDGSWLRFCEDQVIFYPMLERANGAYSVIDLPLCAYNAANPLSDERHYLREKLIDELVCRRRNLSAMIIASTSGHNNKGKNAIILHYSRLLDGIAIDILCYIFQLLMMFIRTPRHIYLSGRERFLERYTLTKLSSRNSTFICTSPIIGRSLQYLYGKIISDIDETRLSIKTVEEYEQVLWTMLFSTAITKRTEACMRRSGINISKL